MSRFGANRVRDERIEDVSPIYANERIDKFECTKCGHTIINGIQGPDTSGYCTSCDSMVHWEQIGGLEGSFIIRGIDGEVEMEENEILAGAFFKDE